MRFERKTQLLGAVVALPSFIVAIVLLLRFSWWTRITIAGIVAAATVFAIALLHDHVVGPLRTIANLLAALREEDYSIRGRGARADDALGEALIEINELGTLLRERRLGALEATALLRTVIGEIDAAIFAFDAERRLRLVNRAGERLLSSTSERLLGQSATELGLERCLDEQELTSIDIANGRWSVRKSVFREHGRPHVLLLLTDLSEEERQAWQRLVRVLSHELNNSLAPIKSIATSLLSSKSGWNEDTERGLTVIVSRAESLTRFMEAYSRLVRLPRPTFRQVDVGELLQRTVLLEQRLDVRVQPGLPIVIRADGDQLEQAVINLVRNGVDAALETGGGATVSWRAHDGCVEIVVADEGRGLSGSANLFVPFYTTKPGGTGIGLVLSRQIADAHGGTLTLENRADRTGCIALLRLPLRHSDR
ncbi:MAG TPA: ATP-binding protein [Thermoanaerobaculia bacterium]|nr:ATP-binding protein [Thermoanaerobaculia bacterium]